MTDACGYVPVVYWMVGLAIGLMIIFAIAHRLRVDILDFVGDLVVRGPQYAWRTHVRSTARDDERVASRRGAARDDFFSVASHVAAWTAFADQRGWRLDLHNGRALGLLGGNRAIVLLPKTYMGGATTVHVTTLRYLPRCSVRYSRWWPRGRAIVEPPAMSRFPEELLQFLSHHRIEFQTDETAVRCRLPTHVAGVVGELLDHLGRFVAGAPHYRRAAASE